MTRHLHLGAACPRLLAKFILTTTPSVGRSSGDMGVYQ
jgi:hypothetical protein